MDDAAQAFHKTNLDIIPEVLLPDLLHRLPSGHVKKVAKDGVSEEEKKAFALTGGKVHHPTENLKVTMPTEQWMGATKT